MAKRTKKARSNLRFARIPTGSETCGWCFMLSSRGFAYNSESSAMASSHKGCDCIVVPGMKDDTTYEGFDFTEMADRWRNCVDTVDNASLEHRARAEWSTMSEAEKRKYHADVSTETRAFLETLQQTEKELAERLGIGKEQLDENAFVRFYQDRLRREAFAEVKRRDADWLYFGKKPQIDYSLSPREYYGKLRTSHASFNPIDYEPSNIEVGTGKNEWRDLFVHDALQNAGIRIKTYGHDDLDLAIDGKWWEVKSPFLRPSDEGAEINGRFIEKDLRKAKSQFKKRGIEGETRVVFSPRYRDEFSDEEFISRILRSMYSHGICEVLYVRKDGSLARLVA